MDLKMALYRTLLRSKKTGKELLREYKPHKRTIVISGTNYHLPMPYTLFLMQHWSDEELKPFIDKDKIEYEEDRKYLDDNPFPGLCVAFAKEPAVNFDSKIYAPMFPNIYTSLSDQEEENLSFIWDVCASDTNNNVYYESDNIQEAVNEFWNSEFIVDEGPIGIRTIKYNYSRRKGKLPFISPKGYYRWWESLDNVEDVLFAGQEETSHDLWHFLETFTNFRYEFIYENGFEQISHRHDGILKL
jgi:hypothetical protein